MSAGVIIVYSLSFGLHRFYLKAFPEGSTRDWVIQGETRLEKFISITGGAVIISLMPFILFWIFALLFSAAMI